jgi:hypothetical protein
MLVMEEIQQTNSAASVVSTALVVQHQGAPSPCTGAGYRGGDSSGSGKPKPSYKPTQPKMCGWNTGPAPKTSMPPTELWVCFLPSPDQWLLFGSGKIQSHLFSEKMVRWQWIAMKRQDYCGTPSGNVLV